MLSEPCRENKRKSEGRPLIGKRANARLAPRLALFRFRRGLPNQEVGQKLSKDHCRTQSRRFAENANS